MITIAGGIVLAVVFLALLPGLIRLGLWLLFIALVLGGLALVVGLATHSASAAGGAAVLGGWAWVAWVAATNDRRRKAGAPPA